MFFALLITDQNTKFNKFFLRYLLFYCAIFMVLLYSIVQYFHSGSLLCQRYCIKNSLSAHLWWALNCWTMLAINTHVPETDNNLQLSFSRIAAIQK